MKIWRSSTRTQTWRRLNEKHAGRMEERRRTQHNGDRSGMKNKEEWKKIDKCEGKSMKFDEKMGKVPSERRDVRERGIINN